MALTTPVTASIRLSVPSLEFAIHTGTVPHRHPGGRVADRDRLHNPIDRRIDPRHHPGVVVGDPHPPGATAIPPGDDPAGIVSTTACVRGSIRDTIPALPSATHTAPSPGAKLDGEVPNETTARIVPPTVVIAATASPGIVAGSAARRPRAAITTPASTTASSTAAPTASVRRRRSMGSARRARRSVKQPRTRPRGR
ncbi:MAG: hypothetical protein JO304_16435 [Solirubrobacterales bacterium]|nr:hypothetical protein [Solirubrobacterales bacterium]